MSFYHTYRPKIFSEVVGQTHITTTLTNALKDDQVVHAYLFCGSRGTGKTSTARILAKAINCEKLSDTGEPCNTCSICEQNNKGSLVDVIEIDAASNRGIDEMRDLREKIQFSPTQAKKKIYIIDEVHMLTKEAFNAILKTLEEPPEHAYFILATTEAHKIPETIISRCQKFNFKRIDENDISSLLQMIGEKESIESEEQALQLIARQANGGMRDAISIFEQLSSEGKLEYEHIRKRLGLVGHQFHDNFYTLLREKKLKEAFESLNDLNKDGYDLIEFNQEFLFFLREKMYENIDEAEELKFIIHTTQVFTESKNQMKSAIIPQLPLEIAIASMTQEQERAPIEATKEKKGFFSWGASSKATETKSKETPTKSKTSEEKPKEESKSKKTENHLVHEENFEKKEVIEEEEIGELNLSSVKEHWNRILDNIKTPFIKISLKDCKPTEVKGNTITLTFKSNFHYGKITEGRNKHEVQNVFEEVFKQKVDLNCVLGKIEDFVPKKEAPKKNEQEKETENLQEMIQEIFG